MPAAFCLMFLCVCALVHVREFVWVLQSMMHQGKAALNISQSAPPAGVTSLGGCCKEANNGEGNGSAHCFEKESPF